MLLTGFAFLRTLLFSSLSAFFPLSFADRLEGDRSEGSGQENEDEQ